MYDFVEAQRLHGDGISSNIDVRERVIASGRRLASIGDLSSVLHGDDISACDDSARIVRHGPYQRCGRGNLAWHRPAQQHAQTENKEKFALHWRNSLDFFRSYLSVDRYRDPMPISPLAGYCPGVNVTGLHTSLVRGDRLEEVKL